ncbi:hypothetical protein SUGI_0303790 [Cryptomeria japonica]|uniref:UPF0496 protein 4 n=1 Tax=Cryptomeria japonica TaxID=3369 RepID=UPI002408A5C8|nr:UPF0496 protein 4 [Cryptomeria japonica]GLJ17449.1 hypothetical protein SUGI_0303790 [Cryptomeria japonica]
MSGSSSVFRAAFQGLSYPSVFHNRSSSSTIYPANHDNPKLDAFESHVCEELRRLEECGNYLSADWLRQALDVCLYVHSMVEENFPHIGKNSKWVNEHLEDMVKLLDICNALRESMSDIKQYKVELQLIVHGFQGCGPIGARQLLRARTALGNFNDPSAKAKEASEGKSRLENCSSMLRRMGERLVAPPSDAATASGGAAFLEPIYASKALMVFVCGVLVAAISTKSKRHLPQLCAGQTAWACSLQTLHHKVKEEIEKGRNKGTTCTLLYELKAVDSSSRSLYDLVNKLINSKSVPPNESQALELRQSVQSLRNCISELESGTAPFERQISEIFRVLVSGRMALLDVLSYS